MMTPAETPDNADDAQRSPFLPPPAHPFWIVTACLLLLCFLGGRCGPIGAGFLTVWPGADGLASLVLPSGKFMLLFALTWGASLLVFLFFPRRLSGRGVVFLILGLSLALRILLLPHPVNDDIYRYLWEGRVYLSGLNPYLLPPEAPQLASLAVTDPYQALVNHPDLSAIYPPAMILLFAAVGQVLYTPLAIKWVVIGFDMGTLGLLLLLLTRQHLPLRYALLYALNPVILYSFAGQAHSDSLQGFFLLAALLAHGHRRWGWMWLLAGAAVQVKYMAVVALPFLLDRENWVWSWAAAGVLILPFLPFLEAEAGLFSTLIHFGRDFGVNGPIHGLLRLVTGEIASASILCLLLMAALLLGAFLLFLGRRHRSDAWPPAWGIYLALAILILCLPTVHFWYLSWILPLVVLYPSNAWMLLSLTTAAYFSAAGHFYLEGQWELTWPYQLVQWLPFGLLFLPELVRGCRRLCIPSSDGPVVTVTVVIPTRNEAAAIAACVAAARRDTAVLEVLVVDGGSTDDTVARARAAGARVLSHIRPPAEGGGRGGQIAVGVGAAMGDVVAIVHADTQAAAGSFSKLCRLLNSHPEMVGGALGSRFERSNLFYRLLTAANDLRATMLGISFGDQVQFFRRRIFLKHGVYPALPLMEDVELSLRLSAVGRQGYLFGRSLVSTRRWQRSGGGHALKVVILFSRYLWQRLRGRVDAIAFFHSYYGKAQDHSPSKDSVPEASPHR
jgi:GT2 family glycosyltransferase